MLTAAGMVSDPYVLSNMFLAGGGIGMVIGLTARVIGRKNVLKNLPHAERRAYARLYTLIVAVAMFITVTFGLSLNSDTGFMFQPFVGMACGLGVWPGAWFGFWLAGFFGQRQLPC